MAIRTSSQIILDTLTFPFRCLIFEADKFGLSSLRTDRFDSVARYAHPPVLDIGCGRDNLFIKSYFPRQGSGLDVFSYHGLSRKQVFTSLTRFPYPAKSFATVTFIASLNHVPKSQRLAELKESFRVLRPGGRIIITMGHPLTEILVHQVVKIFDLLTGTHHDMDSERGMTSEEAYFLTDFEITSLLHLAGFPSPTKHYFLSQWGFNHLFISDKL